MDVNERGHDHHFGIGAEHDAAREPVGLEAVTNDHEAHAPPVDQHVGDVHGMIERFAADSAHLNDALSHLPGPDHVAGAEHLSGGLDHDFGTHHDAADGFHGLHESIHDAVSHVSFDEHHGLGDALHDTHHDDPTHHHIDHFGLGH